MKEPVQIARKAVEVAGDKQASDIILLDIVGLASFTDYFVILTTTSVRHMHVLSEDVLHELRNFGASFHHKEGTADSGWVLLDFGDVIIHMFSSEAREYYQLERNWERGVPLIRIQ